METTWALLCQSLTLLQAQDYFFSLFLSLHVTSFQKRFIFFIRAFYHRIESAHRAREESKMREEWNSKVYSRCVRLFSFSLPPSPHLSSFAFTISATRVSLRCITMNRSRNWAFNIPKLLPSMYEKSLRFSPMSQGNLSLPSSLFSFLFTLSLFHSFTLLAADLPLLKVLKWQLTSHFSCTSHSFPSPNPFQLLVLSSKLRFILA